MARRLLVVRFVTEIEEFAFALKLKAPAKQAPERMVKDEQMSLFTQLFVYANSTIKGLNEEVKRKQAYIKANNLDGQVEIPDGSESEGYWNLYIAWSELSSFLRDARSVLRTWRDQDRYSSML